MSTSTLRSSVAAADTHEKEIVCIDASFEPLIPKFLSNRQTDVKTLQEALAAGDLDAVRRVAHTVKGVGGSYGFDRITEIAAAIEHAAKAGDVSTIAIELPALTSYLDRIEVVFE